MAAQDVANDAAQKVTEGASYVQDKLGAVDANAAGYMARKLLRR
jgi:hypothetical protein